MFARYVALTSFFSILRGYAADREGGDDSEDEDSDGWMDDDEDAELERIRARRMRKMKKAQVKKNIQRVRGGGEMSEITQDEFLPKVQHNGDLTPV